MEGEDDAVAILRMFLRKMDYPTLETAGKAVLCNKEMWMLFGDYIANEYIIQERRINAGNPLTSNMVEKKMRVAMQCVKDKIGDVDADTREFFTCMDEERRSALWKWWCNCRQSARAKSYLRGQNEGVELDQSARPVYPTMVWDTNKAYAGSHHVHAGKRKFVMTLEGRSAGRTAEVGYINYNSMYWDPHFHSLAVDVPEAKLRKNKTVPFCAGATRYNDLFLDWGDMMTMDDDRPISPLFLVCHFLHQITSEGGSSGTRNGVARNITKMVQDVSPYTGLQSLRHVWVKDLPEGASAEGCRPGAAYYLGLRVGLDDISKALGHASHAENIMRCVIMRLIPVVA